MVNPKIKNKIKKGDFFSVYEIVDNIKNLIRPKQKGIDLWRKDTANYILKNFASILSKMEASNFDSLLEECNRIPQLSQLVFDAAGNSIDEVIDVINRGSIVTSTSIAGNLRGAECAEQFLEGRIADFYEKVDRDTFNFSELFYNPYKGNFVHNDEVRKEYMQVLKNATKTRCIHPSDVCAFIGELKKDENGLVFLKEYAPILISVTDSPLKTLAELENTGVNQDEIKQIVNGRIDAIAKEMLGQVSPVKASQNVDEKQKNVREMLVLMLQDLLKNENCDPSEIRKISKGGFANVFGVGDKVVKIGKSPQTYNIPKNSRRFLQPLVRTMQDSCSSLGLNQPVSIEILEKCDTKIPATEEELYEIYKELRQEGMIWTDAKKDNVGRLVKSNSVHFNGIEEVHHANVGFMEDGNVDELEKGELVILDLDFVFDEKNPNIQWPKGGTLSRSFEDRYKKECEMKNMNEFEMLDKEDDRR